MSSSSLMERMKQNRGKTAQAIQSAIKTGGYKKDERIWKYGWVKHPTKKNKDGTAFCYSDTLLRFLPVPFIDMRREEAGELAETAVLTPIVLVQVHDFKGPNGDRYNELSLSTLGQDCPVSEHDRPLWSKWTEAGKPDNDVKKVLVGRIAQDEYYSNVLVIDDKANPENNGKVFLFKYKNAVKKMLDEAFDPSVPTRSSFDPFDPFDGRDMHLVFGGEERAFGNWKGLVPVDMSKDTVWVENPLCGGDEAKIEEVMELVYSLQDFVAPSKFKTYAELKSRFLSVMGLTEGETLPDTPTTMSNTPDAPKTALESVEAAKATDQTPSATGVVSGDAGGDDLDEFERMLAEAGA